MTNCIGRYEIQAELGRGGFGRVFRAFDPTVGRQVAIKTLTAAGEPDLITRFRNEAAAAGRLKHPNIVIIYDFGEQDGEPYLVMELVEGDDLERVIGGKRSVSLLQKLDIMMQGAAGLHHAHLNGIVHRDVKPANIMLLRDGGVKIMDFGIALLTQATAARLTPDGSMLGTFPYMSPEQFYGSPSDALTDIFAYGVTCYKLLTGAHPFHAPEMAGLMGNIMHKAPEPIRALNPGCPEALEEAIFKMLSKDRDSRYQSLDDLQFDLKPIAIDLQKERLGELVAEAKSMIVAGQLETAQTAVRQALEIEPGYRPARELREAVQRQLRERTVRPKIAALVNSGREQLQARQFDQAIQMFESALRMEKSNPEIHALVDQARAAWEQAQRAERLVRDARQALDRGDLTAAHRIAASAIDADPKNPQAAEIAEKVRERMESRERERHVQDSLAQVRRLRLVQNFDGAIEILQFLRKQYPESAEAAQLLERVESEQKAHQRKLRLEAGTAQVKELLRSQLFDQALALLARLQGEFQDAPELNELTAYATEEVRSRREAEGIARAVADARSLMEKSQFEAAIRGLNAAVAQYPNAGALRELIQTAASEQAEHSRRTALEEAIKQTSALIGKERFGEALERIAAFVRAFGNAVALDPVRKSAEEGLERQRRVANVRKLVVDAQSLLDSGRPGTATEVLQEGTKLFPGDPDIDRMLGLARDKLREKQESEAISKIVADAESRARGLQFDDALAVLATGLRQFPGNSRLQRCQEATLAGRTAHFQGQQRREAIERAGQLRSEGKLAEASQSLSAAIQQFGSDAALQEAKESIDEVRSVVEDAQARLETGEIESAVKVLRAGVARYPGEPAVTRTMAVAETRFRELQRKRELNQIDRDARKHLAAKQFGKALELIDSALARLGSEDSLTSLRRTLLQAQAEHQRSEFLRIGNELLSRGQLLEASQTLEQAAQSFPSDSAIAQLLATARERLREQEIARERERDIAAIERAAAELAAAGRLKEAAQRLEQGLRQFPRTKSLAQAHENVLLQRFNVEAARLRNEGDFDRALQVAVTGLQKFPADGGLLELKRNIEAERAKQLRQKAIDSALSEAGDLVKAGRHEDAIEILRQAKAEYGEERQLSALLRSTEEQKRRMEAERIERLRREAIQTTLGNAGVLVKDGRLEEAIELLRRSEYENEPAVAELLRSAEEQKRKIEAERIERLRQEGIANTVGRASDLVNDGRLEEAIEFLRQCGYGDEPRVAELLRSTEEQKRKIEAERIERLRQEAIKSTLSQATELVKGGGLDEAIELLRRSEYAGEPRIAELRRSTEEDLAQRRRAEALAALRKQAETLIGERRYDEAILAMEGPFENESQLQSLLTRARAGRDDQQRDRRFTEALALEQKGALAEALQVVEGALREYGTVASGEALRTRLTNQIETQRRLEQLERDRSQLLEIERDVATSRKGKLTALTGRARPITQRNASNPEIEAIYARIEQRAQARISEPSKPLPWKWIASGTAAAVLIAGVALWPRRSVKVPEVQPGKVVETVTVEIHTDPAGASVKLGDHTCVSPQCRFELTPGHYSVEARLDGYQPVQRELEVDPTKPNNAIDLSLQPIHVEVSAGGDTGTLVVQTGVPDALVFVDNRGRGRTSPAGRFQLPIEARLHTVRVEKSGYQAAAEQHVEVSKDGTRTVAFKMIALEAKLQIQNAPPGAELRMDGALRGKTSGSPVFSLTVPAGQHHFQVTLSSATSQFDQNFEPGQRVAMNWPKIDPSPPSPVVKNQPPTNTPAPDAQAWEHLRDSSDTGQLKTFVDKYPGSSHADEARQKIQSIEKAAQAARDQAAKEQAVRDQIAKEQAAKEQAAREQLARDQAAREQAEKQKVPGAPPSPGMQLTIELFNDAFRHRKPRELKSIWPTSNAIYLESARIGGSVFLQATGAAIVSGDKATVPCQLISAGKSNPVNVTLQKHGDGWIILDISR
jgi:serine/threonine-protein kinase